LLLRSGRPALCSLVAVETAKSLVGAMTLQNPPAALPDECGNVSQRNNVEGGSQIQLHDSNRA
jgi:hypothetical protein